MSSYFKAQAAGVFKPPAVCKSKTKEQAIARPPAGMTMVAIVAGTGIGLLGPWQVNETIRLRRFALNEQFQSNLVKSSNGWWYQVLVEPLAGINPMRLHLAFFFNDELSPAMWSGEKIMGNYSTSVQFDHRVTDWDLQFGSGQADARVWID